MRLSYDLTGAEEIQRDVPVYDASATAAFVIGELLMLGTTDPDSTTDGKTAFVTAYASGSTCAVRALGICMETVVDGTGVITSTNGYAYAKAIINPYAIYKCEYSQDDGFAVTSSSTTTLTIASNEDDIDGSWIFVVTGSPTANAGSLRLLRTGTTSVNVMDSALPSTDTGSTIIRILRVNHALTQLNTAGTKLISTAAAGAAVQLRIIENYVRSNSAGGVIPLRPATHKGLNSLTNAKFYADIAMLSHVYKV